MTYTPDKVIGKYVELRDVRDEMSKRHAEEIGKITEMMEVCESWLLKHLSDNKIESARTEAGTAYKNTSTSATVDPEGGWPLLLYHVLHGPIQRVLDAVEKGMSDKGSMAILLTSPELDLLNHSVNKTKVKEIVEAGGHVPPGVKYSQFVKLGVRRP